MKFVLNSEYDKTKPPSINTWRVQNCLNYNPYGYEVEQLRKINPAELEWQHGLDDNAEARVKAMTETINKGGKLPPIDVVETRTKRLRVLDGHHRADAYGKSKHKTMLAWVSPVHKSGHGLTYELLTGEKFEGVVDETASRLVLRRFWGTR